MSRGTDSLQEKQLMAALWSQEIADDPYAFVMFAFPWGKKGTPLEHHTGPREWQKEELLRIKKHLEENKLKKINGQNPSVYKSATVSGRGVGKSALVAWLISWHMSCHLGASSIITANSEDQLKTKTWAELGTWHTLLINAHWFDRSSTHLQPAAWFADALKKQLQIDPTYYYAHAQLWSEENPESFAGAHNQKGMMVIFDEASGIPKPIWTVAAGFFTELSIYRFQFAFSNGRRNTGEFFECFHKNRDFWNRRYLDSRTVEGTDRAVYDQIIKEHGEDSDESRVEVKGEFPRQGDNQFISREIVVDATQREIQTDMHAALIMGVDPARYGDDSTVIRFRQGRNGKVIAPITLKHQDNMQVANKCAELINKYNPDAVCIDAGNGTGIIDRLREMKYKVYEVWFGSKSEINEWGNKRTELWAKMRDWLKGGTIDNLQELTDDLTGPQYKFMARSDQLILESKEEMKKRGLSSPDHGDALACTFAVQVARADLASGTSRKGSRQAKDVNYNMFE